MNKVKGAYRLLPKLGYIEVYGIRKKIVDEQPGFYMIKDPSDGRCWRINKTDLI